MRLGDLDEVKRNLFSYYSFVNENTSKPNYAGETLMAYEVADMIDDCIENTPTIDPETLPVVKMLKGLYDTMSKVIKDQGDQLNKSRMYSDELCRELEKVKAELDAAIEMLRGYCPACKNYTENHLDGPCVGCKHEYYTDGRDDLPDNWEWRGVKDENNS